MTFEETIERILSCCPKVSRKSVLERLEQERNKAGGLISDETLLRMVAAEFGCGILNGETTAPTLLLQDLIPWLNNISVVGRVVALFSPRAFSGSRKGRLASLLIADESGIMRVVLWNDKASLAEPGGVKVGELIRLQHGYTREDYGGKVEVQAGEKCTVEVNPAGVRSNDYPSINRFITRIGELSQVRGNSRVNIVGNVRRLGSVTEFERSGSSSGKVMRIVLSDGSGEVSVVVWNEKVEEVEDLPKADGGLQIVNGKVKTAAGQLEIHVDRGTYVDTYAFSEFSPLNSLKEGLDRVNVAGVVISRPMLREVKTSKQEVLRLATFELKDETGRIWVSAWRSHADSVHDLKVGDRIVIRNAHVKRGFGDQLELSTGSRTSLVREL